MIYIETNPFGTIELSILV